MNKKIFFFFVIIAVVFAGCTVNLSNEATKNMNIEQQLAQKIMLDLRYYCADMAADHNETMLSNTLEGYPHASNEKSTVKRCLKPLTHLPPELADLIQTTSLGGVILFADNLKNTEQIIQLTSAMQNAALKSKNKLPLFISVDQEGGRVVRLPRNMATSFAGNMAIGATYEKHKTKYAQAVGEVLGSELHALGINVDHAPDVDVNINPNNPVINVRSFGENPKQVAELGIAMLKGMQSKGVIATLKHFPGHGDTNTDSHTGLPIVKHDIDRVNNVDLLPFQQAINNAQVDMIMTAHIQYPALDDSVIVNKNGQSMLKPATLSKRILTDLLRDKMGYKGLVVTDALDMAGISHFFTPLEAVLNTFKAGADIALMPIKIRKPADIQTFKHFLKLLNDRVKEEPLVLEQINDSIKRILAVKEQLPRNILSASDIAQKIVQAHKVLASKAHQVIENNLAEQAIVEVKNNLAFDNKDWQKTINNVYVVFPETIQSKTMQQNLVAALMKNNNIAWHVNASSLKEINLNDLYKNIDQSDLLIIANDSQKTAVEMGGVEDLLTRKKINSADKTIQALLHAKSKGKKSIFIALKSPYNLDKFVQNADCVLASFDGNVYQDKERNYHSAVFSALAKMITGQIIPQGKLPVTI